MKERVIVFKGVLYTDSLKNDLDKTNVSRCQFVSCLDITYTVKHIEHNFYSDKYWHFSNIGRMLKLAVVKLFR